MIIGTLEEEIPIQVTLEGICCKTTLPLIFIFIFGLLIVGITMSEIERRTSD